VRETDQKIRIALEKILDGVDHEDISQDLRDAGLNEVERILREDNRIIELVLFLRVLRHLPGDCSPAYIEHLRTSFFAGANAVYTRMAKTSEDLTVINRIGEELNEFYEELSEINAMNMPTAGSA
jgi:hypothetical protein